MHQHWNASSVVMFYREQQLLRTHGDWRGYQDVGMMNNGIYQHAVIVHANEFVDPVHSEIPTETIEGLWMLAKQKLRYQSGGLFASYLSAFQWCNCHKRNVFGNGQLHATAQR